MVQIGKLNRLTVKSVQSYGIHLDGGSIGDILLKFSSAGPKYRPGEELEVFVYVDGQHRLLATTKRPAAVVGDFAMLRVVATGMAGAFMDWGLENDLLVPKSEQQSPMREGRSYVVHIFLSEKNHRVTASSKLKKFLDRHPPSYLEGEKVELLVYARTALGYNTVVNNSHLGLLYGNEVFQPLAIGRRLPGYVKAIRDDGKIDVRLQPTGYQRVGDISQTILDAIKAQGGLVAVSDKSPPSEIYTLFGVSKKDFKKAVGALYKKRLIVIGPDGIKLAG
jgi:predicted RNA-binding protein (virulence factor B family)